MHHFEEIRGCDRCSGLLRLPANEANKCSVLIQFDSTKVGWDSRRHTFCDVPDDMVRRDATTRSSLRMRGLYCVLATCT